MSDEEAKLKLEHTGIITQLQKIEEESVGIAGEIDGLRDQIKLVEGLNDEVVKKGIAVSEILIQLELETKTAVGEYHKLLASKSEVQNSEVSSRANEVRNSITISEKELFELKE